MKKQFLAKLLVLAMVLTMVPVTFLAASADNATAVGNGECEAKPANDVYSYSVAADTVLPDELPEDGVISVAVVGGTANVVMTKKLVALLPVVDGKKVVKLDTAGASTVSVTYTVEDLVTEDGKGTGVEIQCTQGTISIPSDQLQKAIAKVEAKSLAIILVPSAVENELPNVTVYLDWIATKIPGMARTKAAQ